jgi:tetratricopeptide (TPR) repeat protein
MDFLRKWLVGRDLKRAAALEGEGYYEQALQAYEGSLEHAAGEERVRALRRLGFCALRVGKLARARQALGEAVKLAPTDPDAWLLLGNACLELRDTFGADDAYHEALKHAPERIDILQAQAEYYAIKMPRAGLEAGKRVLRRVLERPEEVDRLGFPRELPIIFLRNLAAEQRMVDDVLAHFDELASRSDWAKPAALIHKGILLANVGRYDEAIQGYLAALTAEPELDEAHFNLGITYTRKRDFDAARASLSVYARKHPTDAATTYGFGFLAETRPDVQEMIRLYTFFLDRIKSNPPAPASLGRLDIARGWVEHARTVLEHAKRHLEEGHEDRGPREVTDDE